MALVLHYPLQDNAASTAIVAAVGSNGTLTGAGNTSASSVAGPGGDYPLAIDFDGTNDYVATASGVSLTGDWSIGAWVKKDTDTNAIICFDGVDQFDTLGWRDSASGGDVSVQTGEENPQAVLLYTHDTNWHHLFVTFVQSSGLFTLYVDGVSVDTDTPGSAEALAFTRVGGNGSAIGLDGRMADFRAYDSAENAAAVLAIYELGVSAAGKKNKLTTLGVG